MSDCKIRSWAVSGDFGLGVAMSRCDAHDWNFGVGGCQSGMCPVGRVEKAIDEGIERINKVICEVAGRSYPPKP